MHKYFDNGSIAVIAVTIILFTVALFVKGLSKDILLEAGVLLVSIKLIMMAYRNTLKHNDIKKDLEEIKKMLENKK